MNLFHKIFAPLSLLMLAYFMLAIPCSAQNANSKSIFGIKYGGELATFSVVPGTVNASSDDWFNGITFEVTNVADKPIRHLELDLQIPHIAGMKGLLTIPLKFGTFPDLTSHKKNYPVLNPQEKTRLTLDATTFEALKDVLAQNNEQMSNIHRIEVVVQYIFFDDNTAWHVGVTMHPSTTRKNFWVVDSPFSAAITPNSKENLLEKAAYYQCATFEGSGAKYECCPDPKGFGTCYITGDAFFDDPITGSTFVVQRMALCPCNLKVLCTYYVSGGSCRRLPQIFPVPY